MIEKTIHHAARGLQHFRMTCVWFLLGVLVVSHTASDAAYVITRSERLDGEVKFVNNGVSVGEKLVTWDDTLIVINTTPQARNIGNNALQFKNGEIRTGLIESMKGGMVQFTSPALGQHKIPVGKLRSLDFQPGLSPVVQSEPNVLYRLRGNPSPGALLSVDDKKITAETALGSLTFERALIERYVFESTPTKTTGTFHAVGLADGSILHGTTTVQNSALMITHAVVGEIQLGNQAWVWACRYSPSLAHLADIVPASIKSSPLILHLPLPPKVEHGRSGLSVGHRDFVRRIHIQPKTSITYKTKAGEFISTLSLAPGARSPAVVRFRSGGKILKEYVLKPTGETSIPVRFPMSSGADFVVEVDFEKTMIFPCGVVMDDPIIILQP